jgi:hypothetical protein
MQFQSVQKRSSRTPRKTARIGNLHHRFWYTATTGISLNQRLLLADWDTRYEPIQKDGHTVLTPISTHRNHTALHPARLGRQPPTSPSN